MKRIKEEKDNIKEKEVDDNIVLEKKDNYTHDNIIYGIKKHNNLISIVVTFCICLLIFGLFYNYYLKELVIETTKIEKDVTVTDKGIADSVEKVYDSVVVIETYVKGQSYSGGSGFVFKEDDKYAYILTNSHVINNSSSVEVTFTNNKKIEAKIVGNDEYADIAVLAVEKENAILIAKTGSSKVMRVGDTTFTVGAPIDLTVYSWTVTRGILSGKDRLVEADDNYIMEVLQTDAAINSGNSGGPLCNSNGEVIGITNMKLASSQIEGMGFAIPIETALEYADSIISGKSIKRPYIGVSIYDANSYFNATNSGVYIELVEEDSPADKAGLKKGDKILKVNDIEVSNTSYFKYQLYKYKIGDKVKITVLRDSKEKEITVTLGSNSLKS